MRKIYNFPSVRTIKMEREESLYIFFCYNDVTICNEV